MGKAAQDASHHKGYCIRDPGIPINLHLPMLIVKGPMYIYIYLIIHTHIYGLFN